MKKIFTYPSALQEVLTTSGENSGMSRSISLSNSIVGESITIEGFKV
jgi:hypothetical protein